MIGVATTGRCHSGFNLCKDAEGIERVTFERIVAVGARAGAKRMKVLDVKRTIELLKRDGRTERHEVE